MSKRANRADRTVYEKSFLFKIKRKKSWDDEGVAATVGTILSLMVFLTGLGMFTNQYVPIWMEDNESSHMNTVISQFSMLKAGIDLQILTAMESGEVSSAPIYTPFKLHADGIPVFASPTVGLLALSTDSAYGYPSFTIRFNYTVGSALNYELNASNGGKTGGSLEFDGMNRFYVKQTVAYENGAIILNQTNGEIVLSGMSIRVVKSGGDLMVKVTQVSLTGINKSLGGFGTKSVTSVLEYANYGKFLKSDGSTLSFIMITKYGNAWEKYFKDMRSTNTAGISESDWSITKTSFTADGQTYYRIVVSLNGITSLEYTKAIVSMTMAEISV
ncbi:MAG: hypothetical protein QXE18_01320 [Thermoplasmata archaeon]